MLLLELGALFPLGNKRVCRCLASLTHVQTQKRGSCTRIRAQRSSQLKTPSFRVSFFEDAVVCPCPQAIVSTNHEDRPGPHDCDALRADPHARHPSFPRVKLRDPPPAMRLDATLLLNPAVLGPHWRSFASESKATFHSGPEPPEP